MAAEGKIGGMDGSGDGSGDGRGYATWALLRRRCKGHGRVCIGRDMAKKEGRAVTLGAACCWCNPLPEKYPWTAALAGSRNLSEGMEIALVPSVSPYCVDTVPCILSVCM